MHITWIIPGAIQKREDGRLFSPMASVRYRVLYVAEHLAAQGHRVDIIQAGLPADAAEIESPLGADVLIVSKGLFDGSVALAERARKIGGRLLLDLCDDHFGTPFRDTYFSLCSLADCVVASTPMMARVIAERTGCHAEVIGDPFEAPPGEPRFQPAERVRLLWFGHPTNFDTLFAMMPSLVEFSRERSAELHVVSTNMSNILGALAQVSRKHEPRLSTHFTAWSPDATWQALHACDAVLIPSLPGDSKLVKSPNRIIESIRRGRFVSAFPLPSYQPFANYAWLGDNVLDGIRWAIIHPREAETRMQAGQAVVEKEFAPTRLARQWETLIMHYAASRAASDARPLRARSLSGSMASARS